LEEKLKADQDVAVTSEVDGRKSIFATEKVSSFHQISIIDQEEKRQSKDKKQIVNAHEELIDILLKRGLTFIDKRNKRGRLWVIGGTELSEFFKDLSKQGIVFTFSAKGGKATNYKPAWYLKK
jgi:hypothetical protein